MDCNASTILFVLVSITACLLIKVGAFRQVPCELHTHIFHQRQGEFRSVRSPASLIVKMAAFNNDQQKEIVVEGFDTSQGPSSLSMVDETMYSISYDPLEPPNQMTLERDLEDFLMERALRFYDDKMVRKKEKCYLVGLEDKSLNEREDGSKFTMEESMTELSELAGAAGLSVVGSTYQRVAKPNIEYYVGPGKLKDIVRSLSRHKCTCVIFDVELSPAQQKNLELAFNQENSKGGKNAERIKIIDRTALILDIFAQHARTKEGQLQVKALNYLHDFLRTMKE